MLTTLKKKNAIREIKQIKRPSNNKMLDKDTGLYLHSNMDLRPLDLQLASDLDQKKSN